MKALTLLGILFLLGGVVASLQGVDGTLRVLPALLLPLPTSLAAGSELPHLTTSGIALVYFLPGALMLALAAIRATFRKDRAAVRG